MNLEIFFVRGYILGHFLRGMLYMSAGANESGNLFCRGYTKVIVCIPAGIHNDKKEMFGVFVERFHQLLVEYPHCLKNAKVFEACMLDFFPAEKKCPTL